MVDSDLDSNESFDYFKYIVTSEIRLKVVLSLYDYDKTLEELNKLLNKQDTNLLRALKELKDVKLIESHEKKYCLTSTGYLLALNIYNLFDNWTSLSSNTEFWKKHSVDGIPSKFLRNTHIWRDAKTVESNKVEYIKPLRTYLSLISQSKDLKIVLPIYSKYHMDTIIDSVLKNDGTLELITSRRILKVIIKNDEKSDNLFSMLKEKGLIKVWLIEDIPITMFFTCTNIFCSLSLFFKDGGYDDSSMLLNKNLSRVKESKYLFDYFTCFAKRV